MSPVALFSTRTFIQGIAGFNIFRFASSTASHAVASRNCFNFAPSSVYFHSGTKQFLQAKVYLNTIQYKITPAPPIKQIHIQMPSLTSFCFLNKSFISNSGFSKSIINQTISLLKLNQCQSKDQKIYLIKARHKF